MLSPLRTLPLYDPYTQPSSWNERMSVGEFAVHSSHGKSSRSVHFCAVFRSLQDAEQYAMAQTHLDPTLRCRIYDHRGFVGAPVQEMRGTKYKGELDFSPRTRKWMGIGLLASGSGLFSFDWANDFQFSWPSVVGSRLLIPGAILLVTEGLIRLTQWQKTRRDRAQQDL